MTDPYLSPPGRTVENGITGTRPKAETKRRTANRVIAAMTAAGLTPQGWQVRSLVATLVANREEPTAETITRELMAAPWFPKRSIRRYRVGEAGWRVSS